MGIKIDKAREHLSIWLTYKNRLIIFMQIKKIFNVTIINKLISKYKKRH